MKKTIVIVILGFVLLAALSIVAIQSTPATAQNTPETISVHGTVVQLSIENKIKAAELVVIGEVKNTHPSRWLSPSGKDPKNASPKEIVQALGLFTDSDVYVNQVLKGNIKTSAVRVRAFSGQTSKVRWLSDIEPSYVIGKTYLLFLKKSSGPTEKVDPGSYIAVGAFQGVYEIVADKAISRDDEWVLEELIAYIEKVLSTETSVPPETPFVVDTLTETPLPAEILITETSELPTETAILPITETSTP
jgi:hypothetical protein